MKKLLFILLFNFIYCEIIDSDLDGVEDSKDLCPDTKITDIVDKNGCTIKKLEFKDDIELDLNRHLDISLGVLFANNQKIYNCSLEYIFKNYSIYLYLAQDNSEYQEDNILSFNYYIFKDKIDYKFSAGVLFWDDKESSMDYFLETKISYSIGKFDTFLSYKYTFVGDSELKNTQTYGVGFGYLINKRLYSSISFMHYSSKYEDEDSSNELSLYLNYFLTKSLYLSAQYTKEFSEDDVFSLSVGYFF